jgi:hypothetical protein
MDLLALFRPAKPVPPARDHFDPEQVMRGVRAHARRIGLDASNTVAAITWALQAPGCTATCIGAGRKRADQLLERQQRAVAPSLA